MFLWIAIDWRSGVLMCFGWTGLLFWGCFAAQPPNVLHWPEILRLALPYQEIETTGKKMTNKFYRAIGAFLDGERLADQASRRL